jgi:1,4-alpha-glucan branching enzyme
MPNDDWQKRAGLRLLLGMMFSQPGKKLLFMGGEFGQFREWNHDTSLDWHLLEQPEHEGLLRFVRDLNTMYRAERALHELDCHAEGFQWIDCHDAEQSTLSFMRRSGDARDAVVVALNFTPVPRHNHRLGVPFEGHWQEIMNSDAPIYGGSGQGNFGGVDSTLVSWHGLPHSLVVTLPPLGMVWFRAARE